MHKSKVAHNLKKKTNLKYTVQYLKVFIAYSGTHKNEHHNVIFILYHIDYSF